MNDRTPETATAVVPAGRMQPPPPGTYWHARAITGGWWVGLELRSTGDSKLLGSGSCAAEPRHIIALSGQLVQQYHRPYRLDDPDAKALAERVNRGQL